MGPGGGWNGGKLGGVARGVDGSGGAYLLGEKERLELDGIGFVHRTIVIVNL